MGCKGLPMPQKQVHLAPWWQQHRGFTVDTDDEIITIVNQEKKGALSWEFLGENAV